MILIATAVLFCCAICTFASAEVNTRIANNGEVAQEREFPYQVSIKNNGRHFCGGSLLSATHVLTAAHCVQSQVDSGRFPGTVTVEVGSTGLGFSKSYKVKRISYCPGFQMQSMQFLPNDIAMIHLKNPVELSNNVATIKLPRSRLSLPPGTKVIVSGFGVDDARRGKVSSVLKKMDAQIVANVECQRYHRAQIHDGKICAAKGVGYGTCKGDSGGPLVDAKRSTLIGVVSGGDGECSSGTPDVYTDVSRFLPYINEEMNWKPGTTNRNPAIDLDEQAGTEIGSWPDQQQLHSQFQHQLHPQFQQQIHPKFQQQLYPQFQQQLYPQYQQPPPNFGSLFGQRPSFDSQFQQPGGVFFQPGFYANKKK